MSCPSIPVAAAPKPAVLSRDAAFHLQASITVSLMAASSAPTPIYALYQAQWGFPPVTTTLVFAVYAIAVLVALLVAGRLSDHVGRRPVLIGAIVVQVGAMALFATAQGVGQLLVARIIQGLSTGAAVEAVAAGMLDLDRERGTVANAVTTPVGTALGALLAGAMVQYLPQPTHLVYELLALTLVLQAAGVAMMGETHAPRAGAWASLRPRVGLSSAVRKPMMLAAPALIASWSIPGFYASLSPALIRDMLDTHSSLVAALGLFVLAASAALSTMLLRDKPARTLSLLGGVLVLAGIVLALGAVSLHSPTAFFAGSSLAGMGFGAGFQGAIRGLAAAAAAHERAGVLSVAFIVSYLSMGLPAIVAGWYVTRYGDLVATARDCGLFVAVLAAISVAVTLRRR